MVWKNLAAWLALGFLVSIIPALLTNQVSIGDFRLSTTFFPVLYFALSSFAIMVMGILESIREVRHHVSQGERVLVVFHLLIFGAAILLMGFGGFLFLSLIGSFFE